MQANVELGSRIKSVRKYFDLNRSAFAARIGTSGTTIKNIEEGDTQSPSASLLAKIAKEFGVNLNWLLDGTEGMMSGAQPIPGNINKNKATGNKIKGNLNTLGINTQASGPDLQAENDRLRMENEHLKQRLKDKEDLIELLKSRS